jgi:hypothetical protein
VMGKGEKGELAESDKVLLRVLSWVDKMAFLLPISMIGVASGDNPLLLLEMRGFEDMKKKTKDLGKGRLLLISRLPLPGFPTFKDTYILFNYFPRDSSSTRVLAVSRIVLNKVKAILVWSLRLVFNIRLPCRRYCHEKNQSKSIQIKHRKIQR